MYTMYILHCIIYVKFSASKANTYKLQYSLNSSVHEQNSHAIPQNLHNTHAVLRLPNTLEEVIVHNIHEVVHV